MCNYLSDTEMEEYSEDRTLLQGDSKSARYFPDDQASSEDISKPSYPNDIDLSSDVFFSPRGESDVYFACSTESLSAQEDMGETDKVGELRHGTRRSSSQWTLRNAGKARTVQHKRKLDSLKELNMTSMSLGLATPRPRSKSLYTISDIPHVVTPTNRARSAKVRNKVIDLIGPVCS